MFWGVLILPVIAAFALSAAPAIALQYLPDNQGSGSPGMSSGSGERSGGFGGRFGRGFSPLGSDFGALMSPFQNPSFPDASEFPDQTLPQDQESCVVIMRIAGGLIAMEIADCPMQTALQEMAELTGIVFKVRDQDNALITVQSQKVSFEEAIQLLAPDRSIMLYYGDENNPERLTGASILPRTTSLQQSGFVFLGTGEITKTNNEDDIPVQALMVLAGNAPLEEKKNAIGLLVEDMSDNSIMVLEWALSNRAPEIRRAVIDGFAHLRVYEALPVIVKSLKDASPGVRISALKAIVELGDARNLKDVERLKADKDPNVAIYADIAMERLSARLR